MGGVFTHVVIGLLSAVLAYSVTRKLEFGFAIFIGNLVPDGARQLFIAIHQGTFNLLYWEENPLYYLVSLITGNPALWVLIGIVVVATTAFLYHHHIIKKKTVREYNELYAFLFIGILTHIIIDVVIIETSPWF